MAECLDVEHRP